MSNIRNLLFIVLFVYIFFTLSLNQVYAQTLTPWESTENLPIQIASNFSFIYNDNIYSLGGANSSVPIIGIYSNIMATGKIIGWQSLVQPPEAKYLHSGIQNGNYVYILGGASQTLNNTDGVSMANIDNSGNITSWQALTPLPKALSLGSSVIIGNKIYFAGGDTGTSNLPSTSISEIYVNTINSDGTIGPNWDIAGHLPEKMLGFGMIESNNYIYIIGGRRESGVSNRVERAPVGTDGTVGVWEELPTLPKSSWRAGVTKMGNTIVVAGGHNFIDSFLRDVYYSEIGSNGLISAWSSGPTLPDANCCAPLVSSNNYLYFIGGLGNSGYSNKVVMSQEILPTPSPTPIPVSKVVFIPGFGASWNVDALVNCKQSGYSGSWTLAPYAKGIYSDLINAFKDRGWSVLPFYYDWRQDVRDNAVLLNNEIDSETVTDEKVNVIGHSMGGLIGRNYIENQSGGKAQKLYMVGTPNRGSTLSYPSFVNAEIWSNDLVEKIAATLLFKHCGVPESVQNLLPTYSYIRDSKTQQIKDISTMTTKNNYLPTDFVSPFWGVKVGTLAGTGQSTLKIIDIVRNSNWPDGKPVGRENTFQGDGTVLTQSVSIDGAIENSIINQSHSGIVGSTDGINKILQFFGSPGIDDPPYTEPKSALVIVGYPGNFWLKDRHGNTTQSENGIITLIDPQYTNYQLQIIPSSQETLLITAEFFQDGSSTYNEQKIKGLNPKTKTIEFKNDKEADNSENENESGEHNKNGEKDDLPKEKLSSYFQNFWNKRIKN